MKRILQCAALGVAVAALLFWALSGASRGWTKTSVVVKTVDEVTGIESESYTPKFVPGVDFLGAAMLGAGVLAGASFLFRKKTNPSVN